MKRRDFVMASGLLAGIGLPRLGQSAAAPCPPSPVQVAGGTSVTAACRSNLEADWVARSTAPGVQWAMDFRTSWEVDKFRKTDHGTDPNAVGTFANHVRWNSDGFTGGSLEMYVPAGENTDAAQWHRPFRALPADGILPAEKGYVSGLAWDANNPNACQQFQPYGWYGNPLYQSQQSGLVEWIGDDFYVQVIAKVSDRSAYRTAGGKFMYLDIVDGSSSQELIWVSNGSPIISAYTNFGSAAQAKLYDPQGQDIGSSRQPGGAKAATCTYPTDETKCVSFPWGRWFCLLFHMKGGYQPTVFLGQDQPDLSASANQAAKNTLLQVYYAGPGDTSYTTVINKSDFMWYYDASSGPNAYGWNGLKLTTYQGTSQNIFPFTWYQRFAQLIFSKSVIPCPQSWPV